MRAWEVLRLYWAWVMVAASLGLALLIYLAYRDAVRWRSRQAQHVDIEDYPQDLQEADAGVPGSLRYLYGCIIAAMVGYVVWVWLSGHSF